MSTPDLSLSSSLAFTAALTLSSASPNGTTCTPLAYAQRLGKVWSSIVSPAKPARAYPSTVLRTFKTPPYPVSPSPITGIETASQTARPPSSISVKVARPTSGMPRREAESAKPEKKQTSKPD
eukprot:CAMPEP_0114114742 /NCGR_PEP_ID=MMETSP0043_2-20121206/3595_1 /TAXON_ID=464988 /ORGANISM="Hemiselmis andersenii, Strain CCMP644" /LENGTH=122 /DNA_ID=CAMNT_0001206953 /DNA_START=254 /DNA_END=619 /DNA_ORIENTATION=+